MKKLGLIGYGKMGVLLDQLAPEYEFEVALRLDSATNLNGAGIKGEAFAKVDVAIEFTTPQAAPANIKALLELGIPVVTGTTGWFNRLPEITEVCHRTKGSLVWSPNFSVGVAVFRRLAMYAAKLLSKETQYGAWAWEIHHDAKKDAPSGTLLHLVAGMKETGWTRPIDTSSSRAGKHPGTHEVGFDSSPDTITIRHAARSREGFAHGALTAAKWIETHSGVHTFEQVLFGEGDAAK